MPRRLVWVFAFVWGVSLTEAGPQAQSPAAPGRNAPQATRCAAADLRGTYGFFRNGTNPQGAIAAVGIGQFDGDGNMTTSQTTSRNGTFTQGSFPGRYDVT